MNTQDNIYIQKRNNRYWVWIGNAEEENPKPAKCDARFVNLSEAWQYARNWSYQAKSNCSVVELSDP